LHKQKNFFLRRRRRRRDMSANNNTTAADRVEKKSIDEAIASFAMLVRCVSSFRSF